MGVTVSHLGGGGGPLVRRYSEPTSFEFQDGNGLAVNVNAPLLTVIDFRNHVGCIGFQAAHTAHVFGGPFPFQLIATTFPFDPLFERINTADIFFGVATFQEDVTGFKRPAILSLDSMPNQLYWITLVNFTPAQSGLWTGQTMFTYQ